MSRVSSLRLILLPVVVFGLSVCVTDCQVHDTDEISEGPSVYGQISVSVDHVSVR